ncbi:MAG: cobalamin-dependent protein [Dehalococcoidales bacterium]
MVHFEELNRAVIDGDGEAAVRLTEQAIGEGVSAAEILDKGLIPGLRQVGELFAGGEYFLPELIVSGEAVTTALELVEPLLLEAGIPPMGKFLIGTVQGDVHDLGKNIVVMMLRGNGWEVTDLGVDISPEEFCAAVKTGDYQVLGMSSLLTMTMPNAARTIEALTEAGLRDKIKIMVGGAPVTREWVEQIGADAYAKDGPSTSQAAAALLGKA